MQSCIFYHQSTRHLDGLHNLVLHLLARPYSGLVREDASPPLCLLISITVLFCQLFLFWFTTFITNTLTFWWNLEDPALSLRVPLSIFHVRRFPEDAQKFLANFLSLSILSKILKIFFRLIHQSYRRSPLLFPGFYFPLLLYGWFIWNLIFPKGSLLCWGSESLAWLIRTYEWCTRKPSPCHLFFHSVTMKVSWDIFPDLQEAQFVIWLSYSLCRGEEN